MISRVLEVVRREVSGARALEDVRAIARFHRVQASPGLDEAAEWVAGALAQAGLAVEHERAPADGRTRFLGQVMPQGWACDRAWADLVDGSRRERLCDGLRQSAAHRTESVFDPATIAALLFESLPEELLRIGSRHIIGR